MPTQGAEPLNHAAARQDKADSLQHGKIYDDDGLYVIAENQNGCIEQIALPYRPGQTLYVRET